MAANVISPSAFPLQFTEVVTFKGDFPNPPDEVANPKGVDYHAALRGVIVSISPGGGSGAVQNLNLVLPEGKRTPFAPSLHPDRAVESKLAIVPPSGPPVTTGGFTPGDVFVLMGPLGQIARVSQSGAVVSNPFVNITGAAALWGALVFDTVGDFGGRLIVVDQDGRVFLVMSNGSVVTPSPWSFLNKVGQLVEGAAVAPLTFGPLGGTLIVGVEGGTNDGADAGKIFAIGTAPNGGATLLANIGFGAESLSFVPARGGTYYQAQLDFEPRTRDNKLLFVSGSQFISRVGRLLAVNELGGEITEIAFDGAAFTQSIASRPPGRWTSEGYLEEGVELEGGCFAVLEPTPPAFTSFQQVPGTITTDKPPAAAVDESGNLQVFVRNVADRKVMRNGMFTSNDTFTGWVEVSPGGMLTNHGLASAFHDDGCFVFAVRDDNTIAFKRVTIGHGFSSDPWATLPGQGLTNTAVAACRSGGRLVVCAKGVTTNLLFLNEKPAGAHAPWTGFAAIPGGATTDASPCVVDFMGELYVFWKEIGTGRIMCKARTLHGTWTEQAPVPVGGTTDAPLVAAADGVNHQLFLFSKGINDKHPYVFAVSETVTWAPFAGVPNPIQVSGLCAVSPHRRTQPNSHVYLFATQLATNQIHFRRTT
jgi:hypothetical protein